MFAYQSFYKTSYPYSGRYIHRLYHYGFDQLNNSSAFYKLHYSGKYKLMLGNKGLFPRMFYKPNHVFIRQVDRF